MDARTFFIFLSLSSVAYGARILVTSVGLAASQNLIMGRTADVLGENGHDVTLLRWIVSPTVKAVKLKHAKEITFNMIQDQELIDFINANMATMAWEEQSFNLPPFGFLKKIYQAMVNACDSLLGDEKLFGQLKSANFDVVVVHMGDACALGLADALGIKGYTYFSTAFMVDFMAYYSGTAAPTSYVPSAMMQVTDQMTKAQRLQNLLATSFMNFFVDTFVFSSTYTDIFRKRFGPDFRDIREIIRDTQLWLVNADPFFEYSRPTQHNVIYVGGLTMGKVVPLDKEWQAVVDNCLPGGIVVFSLGTVANTTGMPLKYKQAFLNVFKRFPKYTFIYRIEGAKPDTTGAKNVILPAWLPQKDLLANPKVKAFITHGGHNSLTEATFLGVPLVVMPLFGDQVANTKRVERKNIGRIIDKDDLTEENIHRALDEVLNSKTIQDNADRLSLMMHKKPTSSLDLLLGWVNFLAEFKDLDSLKPESRNMGMIQYYMLDVLAFIFAFVGVFTYLLIRMCRFCCSKIIGKGQPKSKRD